MIDNSPDMGSSQNAFSVRISSILNKLRELPGGLPDLHVAVVSSDLGAGVSASGNCRAQGGDRGQFLMRQGCGADNAAYLTAGGPGGANFSGTLDDVVSCMTQLGNMGCGFEHQLESVRRALSSDNGASGVDTGLDGFLRPNAVLGIVLLTTEDDCSAPTTTDLFSDPVPGEVPSLRCARAGHLCAGQPMPSPVSAGWVGGSLSTCMANDSSDMPLIRVTELSAAIRALKPNPDQQIVVAGIFGWPMRVGASPNYEVDYAPSSGYEGQLDLVPVCTTGAESASEGGRVGYPGLRMKAFVEQFGQGSMFSICDDMDQVMSDVGSNLARAFR
jgi:hypothetical protein